MILVAGATGQLGGMITRQLLAQGQEVRILVRATSNYQALVAAGAQPAIGDLRDRASLDAACQGIAAVITTAIPHPTADAATVQDVILHGNRNLIDAAQAAGARRFLFVAGFGAAPNSPVPFIAAKGQTEVYLRACGLPYTILEPDMLMDNVLMFLVGKPALSGQTVWIAGEQSDRHSFVATQDVAALAVAAASHPAATNRTLTVGGPEPLTVRGVASIFASVLGRPVSVQSYDPGLPPTGLSPILTGLLSTLPAYDWVKDAAATAEEFGVHLTSVEDFARRIFS